MRVRLASILALVALLALTAFLVWPGESDDGGLARVDGDATDAVEESPLDPITVVDGGAGVPAHATAEPVPVEPDTTSDARRSLGDARTWRDVVRPIAVRGRALVEDFSVAVFATDGSREDCDASDAVAADRPRDDDLIVVLADGLCPRFVRGALLGPERSRDEREVMLVPRSSVVLHADTASPWFVTPDAVQVGAGRKWEDFHGEPARPSTVSMVDALRRLLDDDAVPSERAASLASAWAHHHFDAVTAVGGAGEWPDPFAPFALWQFEEPTAFPLEFDPVAPNRRIELAVHGDALYHFDVEPVKPGFPVGKIHKWFEFKPRPGEEHELTLLVSAHATIAGRFPEGAEGRTNWISGSWGDDPGSSMLIGRGDSFDDDDPPEFETVPLAPGDYRFVGTWRVDQRRIVADTRAFELRAGERKDLGPLSATSGRSLVVRPVFRTFDANGSVVSIPANELGDARFDIAVTPDRTDRSLSMFESLLDVRDLRASGGPLRFDGVPDGEWLVDAERFDPRDSGWQLVDTDPFSIAMPAVAEIELPITLHRGESIEVRLALPGAELTPGSRIRAESWAHGRRVGETVRFRWVDDPTDGPRFVSEVDTLPGRAVVEATIDLANLDDGFTLEPWTARGEVVVEVGGRATLDLTLARAARVIVPGAAFPAGSDERRIEPVDGGSVRLGRVSGISDEERLASAAFYDDLLPRTVYRLVGTDLTFTTGDPGSELVVGW